MSGTNGISEEKTKGAPTRVSDDARTLFAYMLLAGKNVSLYPDGHSISINSIRQFHHRLETYIRRHGDFKIDIEKDRVTCQGEEVYSGPFEEGTLSFTLFRDGIKWLEFSAGVSEDEVRELLAILNHYKILSAEPDGDFATALWEKRLAHVQYEAADIFVGDGSGQADGISKFNSGGNRADLQAQGFQAVLAAGVIDPMDLLLTPEEQALLQAMVLSEETADASSHLFMLLDSLLLYEDEDSFSVVLDVLAEEFKNFLASRDFEACVIILEGMRHIMDSGRICAPWAVLLMEAFLVRISGPDHLKPLEAIWLDMQVQQVGILARILQRLHPKAAGSVALLLLMHKPPQLQIIVEDALVSYANQDADCLEPLISSAGEKMAARLIPILFKVDIDISMKYLMRLVRHPSVAVRRLAVKTIAQGRKFPAADIFELIDDPDEAVRRLILKQLGRARDNTAEDLLLRYLQNNKFTAAQSEHVVECFKALGQCGSASSVPYLRETLLRRKWVSSFLKSPSRRGAALALAALKIPESQQVIEEARRSIHPGLRRILRGASADASIKHSGGR